MKHFELQGKKRITGKKAIATRAKQLNYDAIHDSIHEMAKDEARHGKGFEGLYNRYFKK